MKFTTYKNGRSGHSLISVFKVLTVFFIVLLGLSLPKEADDILLLFLFLPADLSFPSTFEMQSYCSEKRHTGAHRG